MRIYTQSLATAPRHWTIVFLAIMVVCYVGAAITPPFQAPDEFDHIKRAYMFGHGQLVLHAPPGKASGGVVDTGLIEYMNWFAPLPGKANRKVSAEELVNAGDVKWSGRDSFETPVGTAYYFPVLYTPQAAGMAVGQALELSVSKSYRLVRFFTLFTCLGLIYLACRVFPPPPILLAILVLPMNLYLLSSPSLDGMATSMAVLAMASFMRAVTDRESTPPWVMGTFFVTLLLLTACRANAAPFLLLPFIVWWHVRDRRTLLAATACAVLVVGWTLYSMKSTVYPPGPRHIDHTARLISYVVHPGAFMHMLHATLADESVRAYYAQSFLGNLGWLDAPFTASTYYLIAALLGMALVFSLVRAAVTEHRLARSALLLCALATLLMTYLAMLVQWTIGDSPIIQGVQGRYFMIPAIAIAFAVGGELRPHDSVPRRIAMALVVLLLAVGTYNMMQTLVSRYYMPLSQAGASTPPVLKPTPSLTRASPVQVHFSPAQSVSPATLDRIDIMFGTYMHVHEGGAVLRLWTNSGETVTLPFELATLVDNGYKSFTLDPKPYIGGEIVSQGGEGVSVWESQLTENTFVACAVSHTPDNRKLTVPGCPAP